VTSVAAIVPAAGRGERLGARTPKALVGLAGRPLVSHAVDMLLRLPGCRHVVVAAPPDALDHLAAAVPCAQVVAGDDTRRGSVAKALAVIGADIDVVLVHDAARPLTPLDVAERVVQRIEAGAAAAVPVLAIADTVKQVDADGRVLRTVDRSTLVAVQTPQGFRREVLLAAHQQADDTVTDDAGLVERMGQQVVTVAGAAEAFKVTTPADLALAAAVLAWRGEHVR
jgi:2-C-methyl-D-erythritol 4-phosphate cytidylyltransferase